MKIYLRDLIDALEQVNADTELCYGIEDEKIHDMNVENSEDYSLEEYIPLPSAREINEYNIMRYFVYSIEDSELQDKLFAAIRGEGAFKRFRDAITENKLKTKWRKYRDNELEQIAREWADHNDVKII